MQLVLSQQVCPRGSINNILTLVQMLAWRWSRDKTLSEPMMVNLLMHIRIIRPQWVNISLKEKQKFPHKFVKFVSGLENIYRDLVT